VNFGDAVSVSSCRLLQLGLALGVEIHSLLVLNDGSISRKVEITYFGSIAYKASKAELTSSQLVKERPENRDEKNDRAQNLDGNYLGFENEPVEIKAPFAARSPEIENRLRHKSPISRR
jgi:hypothetical protein